MLEKIKNALTIKNRIIKEGLAETVATFIMMFVGLCGAAHMTLGKEESGKYLNINLLFGVGVTMGIQAAGGISGAHMNVLISFMHCILGRLPWRKLPVYITGQFLGSFVAAALVFVMYYDALCEYSGLEIVVTGSNGTARIFSTYPAPYMTLLGGFVDMKSHFTVQFAPTSGFKLLLDRRMGRDGDGYVMPSTLKNMWFLATVVFMVCIFAIYEKKNAVFEAVLIGILVVMIGMVLDIDSGYPINPTRDLPPRIFTAIAGWGIQVFRAGDHWWWVPLLAPTLGSLLGVLIYKILMGFPNQIAVEGRDEQGKDNLPADNV